MIKWYYRALDQDAGEWEQVGWRRCGRDIDNDGTPRLLMACEIPKGEPPMPRGVKSAPLQRSDASNTTTHPVDKR